MKRECPLVIMFRLVNLIQEVKQLNKFIVQEVVNLILMIYFQKIRLYFLCSYVNA